MSHSGPGTRSGNGGLAQVTVWTQRDDEDAHPRGLGWTTGSQARLGVSAARRVRIVWEFDQELAWSSCPAAAADEGKPVEQT